MKCKKLRDQFEQACKTGNLMKKVFLFKQKGEGQARTYQLSEIGERPGQVRFLDAVAKDDPGVHL